MKIFIGLFVFFSVLCLGVPAYSCVSGIVTTAEHVEINNGGKLGRVLHSDLRVGSNALKSEDMKARLQNFLDVRIPLADLPDDDPDKTTDPARPDLFWDKGDLVGRGCVITDVFWDGERFGVSIRRTN